MVMNTPASMKKSPFNDQWGTNKYNKYCNLLTNIIDHRKGPVTKEDNAAANPGYDEVPDEDVPTLWNIILTIGSIHGNSNIWADTRHSGACTNPSESIPPSCEPPTNPSILWPWSDRRPMIDSRATWHWWSKFLVLILTLIIPTAFSFLAISPQVKQPRASRKLRPR